ncbi:thioredoxin-disulfide reductase [Candidatus Uhrbacteria bacterium]|nr:thioredoxin-disulfide reductase [Candidatus Uhrbacteria bacterium]
MSTSENLIIIGSGPAGYTAAIYAARAQLRPLLFEGKQIGGQPGGQLMLTNEVENFPGFPEGLIGPELMERFKKQAERFGTRIVSDDVVSVDFSARQKTVTTSPLTPINLLPELVEQKNIISSHSTQTNLLPELVEGINLSSFIVNSAKQSLPFIVKTNEAVYSSQAIIICTGAKALWLNVPGEKEYQGRGVSACATCDGFFFKDKHVIVVGGGDVAMEEANFLTHFASKVTVIHRRNELRASKIMQERAMKNPKIGFMFNTEVQEVLGDGKRMNAVRVLNNVTNVVSDFSADGLFVAIGHQPNTDLFVNQLELDRKGYIVVKPNTSKTSVEGVFAGGDVIDPYYRQAVTAAGSGCVAALDAERWLSRE